MKYAPLLIKKILEHPNKAEEIVRENISNEQFRDLIYMIKNPFIKFPFKQLYYKPSNRLLQLNLHNEFKEIAKYAMMLSIPQQQIENFLSSCDVHAQEIYAKILTNSIDIPISIRRLNRILPNFIPHYDVKRVKITNKPIINSTLQIVPRGQRIFLVKHNEDVFITTPRYNFVNLPDVYKTLWRLPNDNYLLYGVKTKDKIVLQAQIKMNSKFDTTNNLVYYTIFKKQLSKYFDIPKLQIKFTENISLPTILDEIQSESNDNYHIYFLRNTQLYFYKGE